MRRTVTPSLILLTLIVMPSVAANVITPLDTSGDVGHGTTIAIGADGLPVIAYLGSGQTQLKVAHCDDAICSSAETRVLAAASHETAIAIGSDGLPVISYYSSVLKVAHCDDLACATATFSTVDPSGVGRFSSIAIGTGGFPVISYWDLNSQDLKIAHCADVACASANLRLLDRTGDVGRHTSITIGTDGYPIISYWDSQEGTVGGGLKVAHCSDPACVGLSINVVDDVGDVGQQSSIAIGSDGMPVISYKDGTNQDLRVAYCTDLACASATLTTVDSTGDVGSFTSLAIGNNGRPLISHTDYTGWPTEVSLKLVRCDDLSCTTATHEVLDTGGMVGEFDALAIGTDDNPIVSYWDRTNSDLKVVWVGAATPTPGSGRTTLILSTAGLFLLITLVLRRRARPA